MCSAAPAAGFIGGGGCRRRSRSLGMCLSLGFGRCSVLQTSCTSEPRQSSQDRCGWTCGMFCTRPARSWTHASRNIILKGVSTGPEWLDLGGVLYAPNAFVDVRVPKPNPTSVFAGPERLDLRDVLYAPKALVDARVP